MHIQDYNNSVVVHFKNGMIWQGPSGYVEVDYRSEFDLSEMVMDVTINDWNMKIFGVAKSIAYYSPVLPKMISYGE